MGAAVGHASLLAASDARGGRTVKALSLSRPWTTLVLHHGKDVENRTWTTSYRGPLVVHGALSYDHDVLNWLMFERQPSAPDLVDVLHPNPSEHPTGLLGTVELVGICPRNRPCDCGPWAMPDQAHWRLTNPQPFPEPIPCPGKLGLWTVPDELLGAT